jgi:uncharacterized membrane protein YgaE (UPF0421/DUF939 family)
MAETASRPALTRAAALRGFQLASRAALAAVLALVVAQSLHLPFPIYAMLAAVIVTDLSAAETRRLGPPRLVGTAIGAVVGALVSLAASGPWAMGFGIGVAMLLCHLVRFPDAAKVAGYVPAIVLLQFTDSPWTYAFYRFTETALGIVIAVLVSLLPKLLSRGEAPRG